MDDKKDLLVVVPTKFELDQISSNLDLAGATVEVCGFGSIVPAARMIQLINKRQPSRVVLLGIAGSYASELQIGSAYEFSSVSCYGVGAGAGSAFQTASEMGWMQWPGNGSKDESPQTIGDTLTLAPLAGGVDRELLTVCSAAGSVVEVNDRIAKYSEPVAEDMEGFAVAVACRLSGVPLSIVRGISNTAGDRDKSNWKVADSLAAVAQYCRDNL